MKKAKNNETRRNAVPRPTDPLKAARARRIPGMKDKLSDLLVVEYVAKPEGPKP